jgi:hypothetical protein
MASVSTAFYKDDHAATLHAVEEALVRSVIQTSQSREKSGTAKGEGRTAKLAAWSHATTGGGNRTPPERLRDLSNINLLTKG